jgi:hypothetical protein
MDDYDEERFISGIYNYCDRWCERCRLSDRCYLYHQEQEMMERHLLRGEDPDDPQVVLQDVGESFRKTIEMLQAMAEEMGVDLNNLPPVERHRPDYHEDPLFQRADRWGDRLEALAERVRAEMPGVGDELVRRLEAGEIENPDETLAVLTGVRDAYDVLAHYRYFIPVKIARAAGSMGEAEEEPDTELAGFSRSDALGTAKLADECLGKCIAALWEIAEFHRPWLDPATSCIVEAEALRQVIDTRFPGHQAFRRPGFDE